MNKTVVIIDPFCAGALLAPAFKAKGIAVIAVILDAPEWTGFGAEFEESNFIKIFKESANLAKQLSQYQPIAIVPGTEEGVPLADMLAKKLTPQLANDPAKTLNRLHKGLMQQALAEAGIPALKTCYSASEFEVAAWLKENALTQTPLIIKPPISGGSDKVFHIAAGADWRNAFNRVLSEPAQTTGKKNASVVVQEQAIGTEFAVGTVSAKGRHYLAHLIKYNKKSCHGRETLFDYVEFLPYVKAQHQRIFEYTQQALDALGFRWGASHNEIMLTKDGPRLIEVGARICGGPVSEFSRVATNSSQVDKLVEAYTTGDVLSKTYNFQQHVNSVFLSAANNGKISNLEVFEGITHLPTLLNQHIWVKNGDEVAQTVDYLSSIGIIGLVGEKEAIKEDYQKLRQMESELIIKPTVEPINSFT